MISSLRVCKCVDEEMGTLGTSKVAVMGSLAVEIVASLLVDLLGPERCSN